jgi:hypothetical protein
MTIDEVKENLPDVPVRVNGKVQFCPVRGRRNQRATVFVNFSGHESIPVEYTWPAVCRAANNCGTLIVS